MSGTTRTKLQLKPEEDHLLRILYRQFGITTDNFPRQPTKLEEFTETWNALTGRSDTGPELLHYMITRRKKKKWEKIGRKAGNKDASSNHAFTADDWKHIDAIYEEYQIPSDNFSLDSDLSKKLQDEFARRTGQIVPAMVISAAMVTRRKAGKLTTLKPKPDEGDLGFGDIDQIVG